MAQTSTNMILVRWTNLTDPYDSGQLAENWQKIDVHDHTTDKGVQIPAGGLASNSVTTVKILNENVTEEKIATNAVTTIKIKDSNITTVKLAPSSVTTSKIEDSVSATTGITTAKIADGSVTTSKVADANVTEAKLATNSVTVNKIASSSVTTDKIANSSVTTDKILSNTIVDADINSSANIAPSKIAGTAVITTDSRLSNSRTPTSHSGTHASNGTDPITISPSQVSGTAVVTNDSRLSDTRTPTDNTVSTAKVQDNAITKAKLKSNGAAGDGTDARIIFNGQTLEFGANNVYTGGTATVADGAITTQKIADYVSGSNPITGVSTDKIQDLAVTTSKIARQTSNYVLIGKGPSADVAFGFLTEANFGTNKLSNSALTNSSISINGTSISLGGSISGLATAANPTFTGTVTTPLSTGVVKSSSSGALSSSAVSASDIANSTITKAKLDSTTSGSYVLPKTVTAIPTNSIYSGGTISSSNLLQITGLTTVYGIAPQVGQFISGVIGSGEDYTFQPETVITAVSGTVPYTIDFNKAAITTGTGITAYTKNTIGDEVYYSVAGASNTKWHLRYDGTVWEYLGGAPLYQHLSGGAVATGSSYTDTGVSLALPAGKYMINYGGRGSLNYTSAASQFVLALGTSSSAITNSTTFAPPYISSATNLSVHLNKIVSVTPSSSTTYKIFGRADNANSGCTTTEAHIQATPIYLS